MTTPSYSYNLTTLDQATVDAAYTALASAVAAYAPDSYDSRRGVLGDVIFLLNALLAGAVEQELDKFRVSYSLQYATDNPALADPAAVDTLLANFRVARQPAQRASGSVRIVLSAKQATIISQGTTFTASGLTFQTQNTFTARTSSGQVLTSTDRLLVAAGSNWVFDVDVLCTGTGAAGNLPQGTALIISTQPSAFVQCFAVGSFTGGSDAESNAQLLTRLLAGAAVQAWGSRASIFGTVKNQFPAVLALSATGAGDAEQLRDRHGLFPISSGGRVDLFLQSAPTYQTVTVSVTASLLSKIGAVGTWQFGVGRNTAPGFYEVAKILLPAASPTSAGFAPSSDVRGYDIGAGYAPDISNALEAAYSRYQTATIQFVDTQTDVTLTTLGSTAAYLAVLRLLPALGDIQDWLSNSSRLPLGSDIVVRGAVPCFCTLSFNLVISAALPAPDANLVARTVAAAVAAQGFSDRLSASLIGAAVRSVYATAGVASVTMTGRLRKPDGTNVALSGTETMTLTASPATMTTARTAIFYLLATDITVSVVLV